MPVSSLYSACMARQGVSNVGDLGAPSILQYVHHANCNLFWFLSSGPLLVIPSSITVIVRVRSGLLE